MSHLATNLLASAVLVAVILLVRKPVARIFGARAAFALWLVPALRLVMPPLPEWTAKVSSSVAGGSVEWALIVEPVSGASTSWFGWGALWAIGAAGFLIFHTVTHQLFLRRALKDGRPFEATGVDIDMVMTPSVEGPAATGLLHRLILLPEDFETRFTPEQQRIALLHESLHHRRGDLWASAAALLAGAAMWFSPLTYVALGAFRRDMESACDASVLAEAGADYAESYGETILRSAARPVPRSLCALTSLDELKGRLIMLNRNEGSLRRVAGFGVAAAFALAGVACTAPANADDPKPEKRTIEKRIIINDEGGSVKGATWDDGQEMKVDCPGELTVVEAGSAKTEGKEQKAKMVFCSKSKDPAEAVAGLQKAVDKLKTDLDMEPELKSQVIAKLEARIAELSAKK